MRSKADTVVDLMVSCTETLGLVAQVEGLVKLVMGLVPDSGLVATYWLVHIIIMQSLFVVFVVGVFVVGVVKL